MQRNMNRSIPAGEAMDIAKQVLLAMLMLILLSVLIPARAEEAVSPMIVSEMADSTEYPALEADIPVITSEGKSNVKIAGVKSKNKLVRYTIPETLLRADENFLALMVEAEKYIGYPYVYGGSTPSGFDCSGFTYYVYAHFGYSLNRSSRDQVNNGVAVSKDQLQPGDLVFFSTNGSYPTHVGLYIGDGNIVHASTPQDGVKISSLDTSYYVENYFAARRIL